MRMTPEKSTLSLLFTGLVSSLLISGCGFTPMYGSTATQERHEVQSTLNNISIANIPDRTGQYLRNQLIDRFYVGGYPQDAAYVLTVAPVTETKYELGITKNSNATRSELRVNTSFKLLDKATGETLFTAPVKSTTSYNVMDSQFTTRVSEDNTRLNALDDLARQIEQDIILYFKRQK